MVISPRRGIYVLSCILVSDYLFSVDSIGFTKKNRYISTRKESVTPATSSTLEEDNNNKNKKKNDNPTTTCTRHPNSIRHGIKSMIWNHHNSLDAKYHNTTEEGIDDDLSSVMEPDATKQDQRSISSIFMKDSLYKKKEDLTDMVSYPRESLTATESPHVDILCRATAYMVGMQSIQSLLLHRNITVFEIAAKLLSKESALAMKTIRKVIDSFPDQGIIDVFSLYPTKDLIASILALSRLQHVVIYHSMMDKTTNGTTTEQGLNSHNDPNKRTSPFYWKSKTLDLRSERELLSDLAHYSAFAHAAYGWKFGLLLSGKFHLGDRRMLIRKTGVKRHDIIVTNWRSKTHLPAYFLVRDVERKKIVLSIRGTCSPRDILTDLCCSAEDFVIGEDQRSTFRTRCKARAHHGMLESARGVASKCRKLIATELAMHPGYELVLVGHSLGGAVAAILGSIWRDTFPGLKVYAFGCPCVGPLDAHPTLDNAIVSIVGENDPFSCLSLGHLADASATLARLCENQELRDSILNQTKVDVETMNENAIAWCMETMKSLESLQTAEKLYPPGRILYMKGNLFRGIDEVSLSEVNREDLAFSQLKFHPRMFDLSLHIPHRYEVLLSRIWNHVKSTI